MFEKSMQNSFKRSIAILLIIALVFSMCAPSAFALGEQWQGTAEGDVLIKDTVTKIADNVYEHEVITNNKDGNEQKIDYLCEIGKSDTIKIVAGYGQDDASSWSLTPTTKQAAAYEKNHPGETVVAGINADFFNMATGQPQGALVMEGKVYNNANNRPYFGITKDGKAVIRQDNNLGDLDAAVGGDVILVSDGKPVTENTSYGALKYSRTAIGIKADGTVVTFVTHGLNPPISCGRTYTDIAAMLANEGCVSALALDGGGSSTFAARPEGTNDLVLRNSPADGAERAVSSSLLIVSTAEPTGVFSHAQLTPNNEIYTPGSNVQFEAKGVDTAGIGMELPEGVKYTLADNSKALGTIDENTGVFTAGEDTGIVTVNMIYKDKVVGETKIEIAVPDHIYFGNEEVSLGFEESSDLGIVVRSKGRDMNYKVGDIKWTISDPAMGRFEGNTFISADGVSLTGEATATSAFDENVFGKIKVIVGKMPTVVWDFEDVENEDGSTILAEDYYIGTEEAPGILSHSNYGRGGKESIEIVSSDMDEPVRFGNKSLKLNYDFRDCGEVTEGACIGTTDELTVPGVPTGIGCWVYAPEGVGVQWEGEGSQAGFWLRGYATDGQGSLVQYDFTLEPKKVQGDQQPGIYWEGWKYLEADLTGSQAPFAIKPGMTFRLMFVAGTKMGTRTANSIYFDNLQFVYGANVDDIDEPYVASMQLNGAELENNMVVKTNTVTIDSMLKDKDGKYATGIDDKTVRMYIDGINVVDNDKYMYAYSDGDDRAQLSDVKLKDGKHSITVKAKDGFGNEVNETRYFTVDTGSQDEDTSVNIIPATEKAVIGKTIDLQIVASDDTVTQSTTIFKLGNQFKDYQVKFSDNYEGTSIYNKLEKTITIDAKRKETASPLSLWDRLTGNTETVIATLSVDVPANLKETDSFTYTVKGGKFETEQGEYNTYSSGELKVAVGSDYQVSSGTVILGGKAAEILVKDSDGKPAAGVQLYLSEDDRLIGETDENGILKTDEFNKGDLTASDYVIYAKDKDGGLSFEYKLSVFAPQGELNGLPYNVRFNTVEKLASQKNITWFSNPLNEKKQTIKYRESGSQEWNTVDAKTQQVDFNTSGNCIVNVNAVNLEGLKADTTYEYVLGTDETTLEAATFKTGQEGKKTNEFFIIGDIQDPDKSRVEEVASQLDAKNHNYDFGITIGDAIDQASNYTDWSDLGEVLGANMLGGTNMVNIMGNHEYYGDSSAGIASAIYNNPNTDEGGYYSFEYNDVYVAVINFSNTASPIKEAADWLVKDAEKSNATWKILCMHQPPYYTNNGGNEPVYETIPDAAEKAGIDAVFSGHDHSWAVTNPLIDDKIDEENGIVYYIVGAAGSKRYAASTQDKFDYNTIFKKVGEPFTATYLKVSSDQDEMTINVYDTKAGLLDTVVLKSECNKNGHVHVYDPVKNELRCKVCKRTTENYTGDVFDKDGKEYYLLSGERQTGWVTVGTEMRYYDNNGIREKVTKDETPSTCIIDGFCIYTSESGATKRVDYIDAGGHEYEVKDGKVICTKCGWQQFEMTDLEVSLSTNLYTYNGAAKTPYTTAVDPNGNTLKKRPQPYPDYYSAYKNNVEVGTATVTLTAAKYGTYVDMTSWRGNYKGSVTVKYEIRPTAPTNAKVTYENGKYVLMWDAAKYADKCVDEYVVYQSVNGGEWTEVGTTAETKYGITVDEKNTYEYRIASRKQAKDGKTYESATYATAKTLSLDVKAEFRDEDAKPTLKWNTNKGATYNVWRSTKESGVYQKVFSTKGTTYTHVSAEPGRTYYYKVEASANGATVFSDVVSVTCPLKSPAIDKIEINKEGKPTLKWTEVKGAAQYDVYRADSKDGEYTKIFTTKGTTYTNTSAEAGKTYYYKVAATYNSVTSYSGVMGITCPIDAPELEKITVNSDGKPVIKWNSADGALLYKVYRADSKDGEYVEVAATESTTYVDTNTVPAKTYYYKVESVAGELTALSGVESITCPIDKPVIDKIELNGDGNPEFNWNKVEGAVEYKVYKSESKDGNYAEVAVTGETRYVDTDVSPAKTYYYKVEAVADNVKSLSDEVSITCSIASPVIEKAELNESGKPALKWNKVEGALEYRVYKSESKDGEYTLTFTTRGNTYTNTGAKAGNVYYYKVEAVANSVSAVSAIVSVTCPVQAPVIKTAETNDLGQPVLSWNKVKGAAVYEVYRAESENGEYSKIAEVTATEYTDAKVAENTAYFYKVRAVGTNANVTAESKAITVTSGTVPIVYDRAEGKNRYETAAASANMLKQIYGIKKFDNLIVASGDSYADALAGSYLAKSKKAPILLVNNAAEAFVKDYIEKNVNAGGTVYILGGEGVVSKRFEDSITGYNVKRLGGRDRFETNLNILKEAGAASDEILVCSAWDFADSLSASSTGRPVLLVDDSLKDIQKEYLSSLGSRNYYLIGGTGAVKPAVESEINEYGMVERIAGANRFATSEAIAMKFFPAGSGKLVIASGDDFPDGLTGGPVAIAESAPIVLVNSLNSAEAEKYIERFGVKKLIVIGGNGSVADALIEDLIR